MHVEAGPRPFDHRRGRGRHRRRDPARRAAGSATCSSMYDASKAAQGLPHVDRPGMAPHNHNDPAHQERHLPRRRLVRRRPGPDHRRARPRANAAYVAQERQAPDPRADHGAGDLPRTRRPADPLRHGQRLLRDRRRRPLGAPRGRRPRRHRRQARQGRAVLPQAHRPRQLPALRQAAGLPRRRRRGRAGRRAQRRHRVGRGPVGQRLHAPARPAAGSSPSTATGWSSPSAAPGSPSTAPAAAPPTPSRRSASRAPRWPASRRSRRCAGTSTRTRTAWPSSSSAATSTAARPGTSTARRTPSSTARTTARPAATAPRSRPSCPARPTHDPVGWPTFKDWPAPNSLTHEGTYYRWLERSWRGGQRIFVNLLVENNQLCELYPIKHNSCDDMDSIRLQAKDMYEMQDYIDAQFGGPGEGFYRIVRSPWEARQVINAGQDGGGHGHRDQRARSAAPSSGCPAATCPSATRTSIDTQLDEVRKMGVRQMELVNKFDNALSGVAGDNGEVGRGGQPRQLPRDQLLLGHAALRAGEPRRPRQEPARRARHQRRAAGRPVRRDRRAVRRRQPAGAAALRPPDHCNARGLTTLGEHVIAGLAEAAHAVRPRPHEREGARRRRSTRSRTSATPACCPATRGRPRTPTRGSTRPAATSRRTPVTRAGFVEKWRKHLGWADDRYYFGFGYGADMNGLGAQGDPRGADVANPVDLPLHRPAAASPSSKQHAGERVYDVNVDGVAQYGLYPDWIEDLRQIAGCGRRRDRRRHGPRRRGVPPDVGAGRGHRPRLLPQPGAAEERGDGRVAGPARHDDPAGDGGRRPALHAARATVTASARGPPPTTTCGCGSPSAATAGSRTSPAPADPSPRRESGVPRSSPAGPRSAPPWLDDVAHTQADRDRRGLGDPVRLDRGGSAVRTLRRDDHLATRRRCSDEDRWGESVTVVRVYGEHSPARGRHHQRDRRPDHRRLGQRAMRHRREPWATPSPTRSSGRRPRRWTWTSRSRCP